MSDDGRVFTVSEEAILCLSSSFAIQSEPPLHGLRSADIKLLMTVETDALQAYLIARHDVYVPEMEEVSAKEYHRLLVYRHKSVKVISKILFPGGNNLVAMDSAIDQQTGAPYFLRRGCREHLSTRLRHTQTAFPCSVCGLHLPIYWHSCSIAVLRKFRGDWTLRRKEFAEAIQESEQSASQIKYALSQAFGFTGEALDFTKSIGRRHHRILMHFPVCCPGPPLTSPHDVVVREEGKVS
ncbi:hypothetical protein B0H21DRAFT_855936 [Amylocystis lapponica]|nr:hypothetical protein B0H21DRAFT_855936 [Amylocystis lapponica]